MYYPILITDLTPDTLRSGRENRTVEVHDTPGTTNQSGEERIKGWLGTTNDIDAEALGEFASRTDLEAYLRAEGYIPINECSRAMQEEHEHFYFNMDGCDKIEYWFPETLKFEEWDADTWFQHVTPAEWRDAFEQYKGDAEACAKDNEEAAESQGVWLLRASDYVSWMFTDIREETTI